MFVPGKLNILKIIIVDSIVIALIGYVSKNKIGCYINNEYI